MAKKLSTTNPLEELTSLSELIDRLSIENIRLWNLKDEVMILKKELDGGVSKEREQEIYKILANKAIADVDIVKKRSAVKRAIDESLVRLIQDVTKGKKVAITNEHKSYGK
jgi:hypothetical protein